MLGALRKSVSSVFMLALLGLLIISFAIWGIGDVFRMGGGNAIAMVGDARITPDEFSREFQNEVSRLRQQLGPDFSTADARALGLPQQVLQRMVNRAIFDEATRELGLYASDAQVRETIRTTSAFQNSFGEFDRQLYEYVLRFSGMSAGDYEDAIRTDITRNQLISTLVDGVVMPDALASRLFVYHGERRTVDVVRFPASAVRDIPPPDDETLRAFFDQNRENYRAPEYRTLSYLVLSPDTFAAEVEVTEDDLVSYYEAHRDEYGDPEQRAVEQILLDDEATAQQAYDAIAKGKSFLAVAEEMTGFGPEDVSLGLRTRDEVVEDLGEEAANAVFTLGSGEVAPPVEGPFGWHILRVTNIIPGSSGGLDDVRTEVERAVRTEKALDLVYDRANSVDEELAGGASLADVARSLQLEVSRVAAVDRDGRGPDGARIQDLPDIADFLEQAFATEHGTNRIPELHDAGDNIYYALVVEDVTPAADKPFDEAASAVREDWLAMKRDEASRAAAEAAKAGLAEGGSLEDSAGAYGRPTATAITIARIALPGTANVADDIRRAAFAIEPGEVGVTPGADGDGYLLIRVISTTPGDPGTAAAVFDVFGRQLREQYISDVVLSYQRHLFRKLNVRFNEGLLETTLNEIGSGQPQL